MLEKLIQQLAAAQPLDDEQIRLAVDRLADETVPADLKAGFLAALAQKGETPAEIAAFARALRDKSISPPLDAETRSREILDVVGTGGDRLGTINISTTAAILCAAAGVAVAKHGNRAVTSQAGSADVLEALGVQIDLTPAEAARSLRERNFAFFFASDYHPAFKNISAARKICAGRGQRTIFNLLGPLLNPARPSAMLMGVPRPELCEPLAQVLQSLDVRRAMVVCGKIANQKPQTANYLDELSTLGENTIAEFYQERGFTVSTTLPEQFPLQSATLADLLGGDKTANAKIVREILSGQEHGPKRDAVLLNAAAALFVAGKTKSFAEGWDLACETIDSGRANAKLAELAR
ncbi:MAG TPA: anthranilate phosphoribosyltransferase [Verrucomicrobiae bacterium]